MIGNEVSRWVLSALFAGLGVWYLAAAGRELLPVGRPGRVVPAVGAGLHAVMCAVMLGMSWPWGAAIPAIAQVTVFTAGGGWFAGQALFGVRSGASWYQAAMMAAMVWMAVAMSVLTTPATVLAASGTGGTAEQMGPMPGMAAAVGPGQAVTAMGAPAWWVSAGCLLLCAAFAGAALYFAVTLWPRPARGAGAGAMMAAGMAVTFLQIART